MAGSFKVVAAVIARCSGDEGDARLSPRAPRAPVDRHFGVDDSERCGPDDLSGPMSRIDHFFRNGNGERAARVAAENGNTKEWRSKALPRYQRLTKKAS